MSLIDNKSRCTWVNTDPIYLAYHDHEWGVPIHDDRLLFEFLILEGMQAGLSWITILKRRDNYRASFDNFDAETMACYDDKKYQTLLTDSGIIRNRLKIQAAISNAKAYLKIKEQADSFANYLWNFVDGHPLKNHWQQQAEVPTRSITSDQLSKDLRQRGFKFVGSTICYAFMQAVGMVDDHIMSCFRY